MARRRNLLAHTFQHALLIAAGALLFCLPSTATTLGRAWPDVAARASIRAEGACDAALIVGIENYAFVPKVPGAAKSATDWYAFLTESRRVPEGSTHLLRDRDATREQILDQIELAAREVMPGGTLWIVFIGHGAPWRDGSEGVLVAVDAQQGANPLYARSIRQSELLSRTAGTRAAHTVAVFDACFSGRAADGDPLVPSLQPLIPLASARALAPNITVASAGTGDQFAGSLPGLGRPAFSYLLLGAMRGWGDEDGDGVVTLDEGVRFAARTLKVLVTDRSQTPQIQGGEPQLALARGGAEGAPDLRHLATTEPSVITVGTPGDTGRATADDSVVPVHTKLERPMSLSAAPASPRAFGLAPVPFAPASPSAGRERATQLLARCNARMPEACAALAAMYDSGRAGIPQSDEAALRYYQIACDGGSRRACAWLAGPPPALHVEPARRRRPVDADVVSRVLESRGPAR